MTKKKGKDLVTVGTHVPLTTKMTLQSMAESQNTSVYSLLQEWIEERVNEYSAEIDELKGPTKSTPIEELEGKEDSTEQSDDDLLS